jgi:hypothetical protein
MKLNPKLSTKKFDRPSTAKLLPPLSGMGNTQSSLRKKKRKIMTISTTEEFN